MTIRTAEAEWNGDLAHGSGQMRLESGSYDGPYDFSSRMDDGKGASPEELLGAAHAGCFSIALLLELTKAGFLFSVFIPKQRFISNKERANGPSTGSISKQKHRSRLWRQLPWMRTRGAPRTTAQCRAPCRASTSI